MLHRQSYNDSGFYAIMRYWFSFRLKHTQLFHSIAHNTYSMGPKKPEIEYIHLPALDDLKQRQQQQQCPPPEYDSLRKLAQGALKKGPFSITFEKNEPYIAASGDKRDFLSYAP